MSARTARATAWTAFGAALALSLPGAVLAWIVSGTSAQTQSGNEYLDAVLDVLSASFLVVLFAFPIVGLLIARRRAESPIGWLLLAIGVGWGLLAAASGYADYGLKHQPGSLPHADVAAAFGLAIWAPPVGLMGTFLLLLFPDGSLPGRRWRWVAWTGAFSLTVCTVVSLVEPGPMTQSGYAHVANPFGIESLRPLLGVAQYVVLVLALAIAASAASLVVRFRRSGATERLQIKWLAAAAAVVAIVYLSDLSISATVAASATKERSWLQVVDNLAVFSFGLIPIAIGIAVLRHRLYEIDVIVRKTLVYTALVTSLAVLYVGGVFAIERAVRSVSGQSGTLAVTISTLAVAIAFQPLRARIQRLVDRRFYRARYDATRTLEAFAGRLREQVDVDALSDELLHVVHETLRPAHATLWLRARGGER